MDLINSSLRGIPAPLLHVVDGGNGVQVLERLQGQVQGFMQGNVAEVGRFDEGFGKYINSPNAQEFAQYRVNEAKR